MIGDERPQEGPGWMRPLGITLASVWEVPHPYRAPTRAIKWVALSTSLDSLDPRDVPAAGPLRDRRSRRSPVRRWAVPVALQPTHDLGVRDLRELPVPLAHGEEQGRHQGTDEPIDQGTELLHRFAGRNPHREDDTARPMQANCFHRTPHRSTGRHAVVDQDDRATLEIRRSATPAPVATQPVDFLGLRSNLGVEILRTKTQVTNAAPIDIADSPFRDGPQSVFPIPRGANLSDHEDVERGVEPVGNGRSDGDPSPRESEDGDPTESKSEELFREANPRVGPVPVRGARGRHLPHSPRADTGPSSKSGQSIRIDPLRGTGATGRGQRSRSGGSVPGASEVATVTTPTPENPAAGS